MASASARVRGAAELLLGNPFAVDAGRFESAEQELLDLSREALKRAASSTELSALVLALAHAQALSGGGISSSCSPTRACRRA